MGGVKINFKGRPPKHINAKEMRFELLNGLRSVRTQMLKGFKMTTAAWDHQPDFEGSKPSLAGGIPTVSVETDDDIYTIVNEGSPRHYIAPNGDYPLFFNSEYEAKTAPGVIDSWGGGAGERDTFASFVDHPGFPGRHFDQAIGVTLQQFFFETMEEAMHEAARKSGW